MRPGLMPLRTHTAFPQHQIVNVGLSPTSQQQSICINSSRYNWQQEPAGLQQQREEAGLQHPREGAGLQNQRVGAGFQQQRQGAGSQQQSDDIATSPPRGSNSMALDDGSDYTAGQPSIVESQWLHSQYRSRKTRFPWTPRV